MLTGDPREAFLEEEKLQIPAGADIVAEDSTEFLMHDLVGNDAGRNVLSLGDGENRQSPIVDPSNFPGIIFFPF